jgi:hypothetical protein
MRWPLSVVEMISISVSCANKLPRTLMRIKESIKLLFFALRERVAPTGKYDVWFTVFLISKKETTQQVNSDGDLPIKFADLTASEMSVLRYLMLPFVLFSFMDSNLNYETPLSYRPIRNLFKALWIILLSPIGFCRAFLDRK